VSKILNENNLPAGITEDQVLKEVVRWLYIYLKKLDGNVSTISSVDEVYATTVAYYTSEFVEKCEVKK